MNRKEHLTNTSRGLIQEFDQFLKDKGISTDEMPFFIKKIQFGIKENTPDASKGVLALEGERKCIKYESKLVQRTNPATGEKYWQLEERCVLYDDEV